MMPPSPHTPENWSAVSNAYAQMASRMMEPYAAAIVERLELDETMSVLEVGAGTGALTMTLAAKAKSVLATDFAPQMIEVLRERIASSEHTNVRLEVLDGQALDLEDGSFDRAASSFALMLFPDRAKGFAELRRVLRPGGRVAVSAWAGPEEFAAFAVVLGATKRAFPDMPPPPRPPAVFSLANPATFTAELEAAGFAEVCVDKVTHELVVEDSDDLWGMVTSGGASLKVLLDRIGEGGKKRLRDVLTALVEERWGAYPIRLSNTATIGYGIAS